MSSDLRQKAVPSPRQKNIIGRNKSLTGITGAKVNQPFHLLEHSHQHFMKRDCRHSLIPQIAQEALDKEKLVMEEAKFLHY